MKRLIVLITVLFVASACTSPTPAPIPTLSPTGVPTVKATLPPGVYRPLEKGSVIEGGTIDYVYPLPSGDKPVITIAAAENLLQLMYVKSQLVDGLVAFAKEIEQAPHTIYAFDENNSNQTEPKLVTIDANKPLEYLVLRVEQGPKYWSVTERQESEIRAAYKLVRRSDGGLTFVDAYDLTGLNSFSTLLPGSGGAGLVFSSRLALLKTILNDQGYQRGENVMATRVPATGMYDPRVLRLDPSKQGLEMNVDWVIQSRPVPNPGQTSP